MGDRISVDSETIKELRSFEEQKGGKEEADWLLYQYGNIVGVTNTRGQRASPGELPRAMAQAAISDGILGIEVQQGAGGIIVVRPSGARSVEDDHFCAGYVAGVLGELLGEPHVATVKDGAFELSKSDPSAARERPVSKVSSDLVIPKLERGESYLIVDEVKNAPATFNIFAKAVKYGLPGLCISRIFPPKARERYDDVCGHDYQIVWLSTSESSGDVPSIKPSQYDHELTRAIGGFLKETGGIVMLHGIEFLISNNSFPVILKFAQRIRDVASVSGGIFLISVDPSTLDALAYNNLKSEFNVYGD
ncbi:MAG: DUF835 domain-containing protein [Methanobacteriota archaeon]